MWGQEKAASNQIANVDIHQAYAQLGGIFDSPVSLQIGRFESAYGSQRFLGSSQWSYISTAFDGVRFSYKTKPYSIDLFHYTISNNSAYMGGMLPDTTKLPVSSDTSFTLSGFWATLNLIENHSFDIFGYYDWDRKKDEFERRRKDTTFKDSRTIEVNRYTIGGCYAGKFGDFSVLFEGAYQGGSFRKAKKANKTDTVITYSDIDIKAYTAALRVQYDFSPFAIALNAETHSGTDGADDSKKAITEYNTYDNTYSTKHSIYGYMDYFTDIKKSTKELGLYDFFLRFLVQPKNSDFSGQADIHYFMLNKEAYDKVNDRKISDLGTEIDLVVKYNFMKNASIELGNCIFVAGKAMKLFYDFNTTDNIYDRDDIGHFSYLMLRLGF